MSKKIIEGRVLLRHMYLKEIPEFLGEVDEIQDGEMDVDGNELTDLTNCPRVIDGYFSARKTNIRSLEGCPRIIKGDFDISSNSLTSLEHSPDSVNGIYDCRRNFNLRSLKGCTPVLSKFDASNCDLRSLIGGPTIVRLDYDTLPFYIVTENKNLSSLEGAPTEIDGNFFAYGCNLRDLKGAPQYVRHTFNVGENPLESLEGCPKRVDGNFICYPQGSEKDNSLQTFTEEQIRSVCDVRGKVILKRRPLNLNI